MSRCNRRKLQRSSSASFGMRRRGAPEKGAKASRRCRLAEFVTAFSAIHTDRYTGFPLGVDRRGSKASRLVEPSSLSDWISISSVGAILRRGGQAVLMLIMI
ncbi:MAG: hypothetical protein ACXW6V_18570, partial [Candidatus Binatia bacterium]